MSGLPGSKGILDDSEIDFLVERAREHGAFISYKSTAEGEVPYEINCTCYSALNPDSAREPRRLQVKRFVAARSIALALRGVPGIYFHGLIGSRNDVRLALETKTKRDINRAMVDEDYLERYLEKPDAKLHHVRDYLGPLLEIRTTHRCFHPGGPQRILSLLPPFSESSGNRRTETAICWH